MAEPVQKSKAGGLAHGVEEFTCVQTTTFFRIFNPVRNVKKGFSFCISEAAVGDCVRCLVLRSEDLLRGLPEGVSARLDCLL